MPCDSVYSIPLVTAEIPDRNGFVEAAKRLGFLATLAYDSVIIRVRGGTTITIAKNGQANIVSPSRAFTAIEGTNVINSIRREYSREVVRQAAQRFSWKLEQKNETNFAVTRRRV